MVDGESDDDIDDDSNEEIEKPEVTVRTLATDYVLYYTYVV